jgi:hypothetical protein
MTTTSCDKNNVKADVNCNEVVTFGDFQYLIPARKDTSKAL